MEFEYEIIAFLLRSPDGPRFMQAIDGKFFQDAQARQLLKLAKSFYEKYQKQPSIGSFIRYVKNDELAELVRIIYEIELTDFVREELAADIQLYLLKSANIAFASDWKRASVGDYLSDIAAIQSITSIGGSGSLKVGNRGEDFLSYDVRDAAVIPSAHRTEFNKFNALTEAGGFYSPQIILFLASPKAGKTLHLMNFARGHVKYGLKVAYIDVENGKQDLRKRFNQSIMDARAEELLGEKKQRELQYMKRRYSMFGGALRVYSYTPRSASPKDVAREVAADGFEPDVWVWDYPDRFNSSNYADNREKLTRIQGVYNDIATINVETSSFCYVVSQVKQSSVNKKVLDMTDFAEDFAKAANATAGFAICQTEEEERLNIERIVPMFQRQGVSFRQGIEPVIFFVQKDRQRITEIGTIEDLEEFNRLLREEQD